MCTHMSSWYRCLLTHSTELSSSRPKTIRRARSDNRRRLTVQACTLVLLVPGPIVHHELAIQTPRLAGMVSLTLLSATGAIMRDTTVMRIFRSAFSTSTASAQIFGDTFMQGPNAPTLLSRECGSVVVHFFHVTYTMRIPISTRGT
jgi:hypothetical protein